MKNFKKFGNIVLAVFLIGALAIACTDPMDVEPIDLGAEDGVKLEDRLENRPDTGDLVG